MSQKLTDHSECPLCMEPLEIDDINFYPCTCGYQICRFCWHRIRTNENGLCPACRKQYPEDPAEYKPLSTEELQKIKNEKRQKDLQKKQKVSESRKLLSQVRVVQKNLLFVVGLTQKLADVEVLKKPEFFGRFGKINKVVVNTSTTYAGTGGPTASAYITFFRSEDALRAIQFINQNHAMDGRTVKASLGTTKYCSHFLKGSSCPKTDCMYLHEMGEDGASFTKEEMQAGKHQEYEQRLLIEVCGSPSPALPICLLGSFDGTTTDGLNLISTSNINNYMEDDGNTTDVNVTTFVLTTTNTSTTTFNLASNNTFRNFNGRSSFSPTTLYELVNDKDEYYRMNEMEDDLKYHNNNSTNNNNSPQSSLFNGSSSKQQHHFLFINSNTQNDSIAGVDPTDNIGTNNNNNNRQRIYFVTTTTTVTKTISSSILPDLINHYLPMISSTCTSNQPFNNNNLNFSQNSLSYSTNNSNSNNNITKRENYNNKDFKTNNLSQFLTRTSFSPPPTLSHHNSLAKFQAKDNSHIIKHNDSVQDYDTLQNTSHNISSHYSSTFNNGNHRKRLGNYSRSKSPPTATSSQNNNYNNNDRIDRNYDNTTLYDRKNSNVVTSVSHHKNLLQQYYSQNANSKRNTNNNKHSSTTTANYDKSSAIYSTNTMSTTKDDFHINDRISSRRSTTDHTRQFNVASSYQQENYNSTTLDSNNVQGSTKSSVLSHWNTNPLNNNYNANINQHNRRLISDSKLLAKEEIRSTWNNLRGERNTSKNTLGYGNNTTTYPPPYHQNRSHSATRSSANNYPISTNNHNTNFGNINTIDIDSTTNTTDNNDYKNFDGHSKSLSSHRRSTTTNYESTPYVHGHIRQNSAANINSHSFKKLFSSADPGDENSNHNNSRNNINRNEDIFLQDRETENLSSLSYFADQGFSLPTVFSNNSPKSPTVKLSKDGSHWVTENETTDNTIRKDANDPNTKGFMAENNNNISDALKDTNYMTNEYHGQTEPQQHHHISNAEILNLINEINSYNQRVKSSSSQDENIVPLSQNTNNTKDHTNYNVSHETSLHLNHESGDHKLLTNYEVNVNEEKLVSSNDFENNYSASNDTPNNNNYNDSRQMQYSSITTKQSDQTNNNNFNTYNSTNSMTNSASNNSQSIITTQQLTNTNSNAGSKKRIDILLLRDGKRKQLLNHVSPLKASSLDVSPTGEEREPNFNQNIQNQSHRDKIILGTTHSKSSKSPNTLTPTVPDWQEAFGFGSARNAQHSAQIVTSNLNNSLPPIINSQQGQSPHLSNDMQKGISHDYNPHSSAKSKQSAVTIIQQTKEHTLPHNQTATTLDHKTQFTESEELTLPIEDDLGFDPWNESSKALEELIQIEKYQPSPLNPASNSTSNATTNNPNQNNENVDASMSMQNTSNPLSPKMLFEIIELLKKVITTKTGQQPTNESLITLLLEQPSLITMLAQQLGPKLLDEKANQKEHMQGNGDESYNPINAENKNGVNIDSNVIMPGMPYSHLSPNQIHLPPNFNQLYNNNQNSQNANMYNNFNVNPELTTDNFFIDPTKNQMSVAAAHQAMLKNLLLNNNEASTNLNFHSTDAQNQTNTNMPKSVPKNANLMSIAAAMLQNNHFTGNDQNGLPRNPFLTPQFTKQLSPTFLNALSNMLPPDSPLFGQLQEHLIQIAANNTIYPNKENTNTSNNNQTKNSNKNANMKYYPTNYMNTQQQHFNSMNDATMSLSPEEMLISATGGFLPHMSDMARMNQQFEALALETGSGNRNNTGLFANKANHSNESIFNKLTNQQIMQIMALLNSNNSQQPNPNDVNNPNMSALFSQTPFSDMMMGQPSFPNNNGKNHTDYTSNTNNEMANLPGVLPIPLVNNGTEFSTNISNKITKNNDNFTAMLKKIMMQQQTGSYGGTQHNGTMSELDMNNTLFDANFYKAGANPNNDYHHNNMVMPTDHKFNIHHNSSNNNNNNLFPTSPLMNLIPPIIPPPHIAGISPPSLGHSHHDLPSNNFGLGGGPNFNDLSMDHHQHLFNMSAALDGQLLHNVNGGGHSSIPLSHHYPPIMNGTNNGTLNFPNEFIGSGGPDSSTANDLLNNNSALMMKILSGEINGYNASTATGIKMNALLASQSSTFQNLRQNGLDANLFESLSDTTLLNNTKSDGIGFNFGTSSYEKHN